MKKNNITHLLVFMNSFAVGVFLMASSAQTATALSGSDFNKANIIDDSVFFDSGTMSASQVQSFLNAKVPICDTNGTKPYAGTTRAAYGRSRGYPPPYICLKNYRQSTPLRAGESGLCAHLSAKSDQTAAQIIRTVSVACGINPQVLIVLLQKEQSLVTDDWPWSIQYRSATGYGCPDTAPCDSEYYGFFNQVYSAARQFNRYVVQPERYNYAAGRTSFISYQANAPSCSGTNVTIQNHATAALYNYTPYQPNAAALANLYGTGNSCSAYGNRNFWRMFNDWFGTTLGSYLVRSPNDTTVFLVSGDKKYPIPNLQTMHAIYPLGSAKFVSAAYLAGKTTQSPLKRLIKSEDSSTIYFFDSGIKLRFSSCAAIEHFGMTCSDAAELTQLQIDEFATGPNMPFVMNTTSGKWFYMRDGEKLETTGLQALADNSFSTTHVKLRESSLANLSLGTPVVSPNSIMTSRGSGNEYLYSENKRFLIPTSLKTLSFFRNMKGGKLDAASIVKFANITFNGFATDGTQEYIFDNQGKVELENSSDWSNTFTTLPAQLLGAIPDSSTLTTSNRVYKGSSSTIYRILDTSKVKFPSWIDLELYSTGSPAITNLPQYYIDSLEFGGTQYGSTRLLKAHNDNTVFMIDGPDAKLRVSAFSVVRAAGIDFSVISVAPSVLAQYATDAEYADHRIKCGSSYYLATLGRLRTMSTSMKQAYGFDDSSFLSYNSSTCSNLPKSGSFTARYIKTSGDNTIFYVENGTKRPLQSYSRYVSHGGTKSNTVTLEKTLTSTVPAGLPL